MTTDCILINDGDYSKSTYKSFSILPRKDDYLIIDDVSVIVKAVVVYNKLKIASEDKDDDNYNYHYNDERYVILTETVSNIDAFVLAPVKRLIESR